MLPVKAVRLQLGELLGADATTLAPALLGNKIKLVKSAIVLDEDAVLADFTLADFTGSAPKVCGTGAQNVGVDGNTGEQIITLLEPAGGWVWEASALTLLPQTVFGFILTSNDDLTLLAVGLLPQSALIAAIGDQVVIGAAQLTIVVQPVS